MRLAELAMQTGTRVEGDSNTEITGAAGLNEALPGQITFLSNPRYTSQIGKTRASAIFASEQAEIGRDIPVLRETSRTKQLRVDRHAERRA